MLNVIQEDNFQTKKLFKKKPFHFIIFLFIREIYILPLFILILKFSYKLDQKNIWITI